MTAVLLTEPQLQFFDDNGDPLAGGKLYAYDAGTTTPKDTYTNAAGNVANTNPVVLDAAGRAAIWISGSYKFVLTDSADVEIWTEDNVTSFASGALGTTVTDSSFTIQNASDQTKQARFSLANLTTGTTTVITVPDGNFTIATVTNVADSYTRGWTVANNTTDATNDIDFAAGGGWLSENNLVYIPTTNSTYTKRLDATWAAGTNQGGLFSGSKANTTNYYLFAIYNPTTVTVDFGFDTSITAANRPSGYTEYVWLGMVRTDGSAAILPFRQNGDYFYYNDELAASGLGVIGTTWTTFTAVGCPAGRPGNVIGNAGISLSGTVAQLSYRPTGTTGTTGIKITSNDAAGTAAQYVYVQLLVNTSAQLDFKGSAASSNVVFNTGGFNFRRGRL